jgi:DNA-binding beta-propeller fold protein YncE
MTRTLSSRLALLAAVVFVVGACASSDPGGRDAPAVVEPVLVGGDLDPTPAAEPTPAPPLPEAGSDALAETPAPAVAPADADDAAAAEPATDRLLLGTGRGVVALDPSTDTVVNAEPAALASRDGRRLVQARIVGDTTDVVVLDAGTGAVRATQSVEGQWAARVLSDDGRRVVLGPTGSYTDGRDRTSLLAVEPEAGTVPQSLYVVGNVEPEAFSTDGRALFVLQYTPAGAPTQYQVRRLDLTTGAVDDVPDKASGWGDAMAGTARTHALAPDGRRLYTLYTTGDPMAGTATAFVHVLDLDEQWAFCVFLPVPFGVGGGGGPMTIAVAPDSSAVYVTDLHGAAVAVIDAATLTVSSMARIENLQPTDAPASSLVAPDGTLWIAQGNAAASISADLAGYTGTFFARGLVSGVALSSDAHRLYLGLADEIQVFDVRSRTEVGLLHAPGIGGLTSLDPADPPIDPTRSSITCTAVTPVALGPGSLARGRVPRC